MYLVVGRCTDDMRRCMKRARTYGKKGCVKEKSKIMCKLKVIMSKIQVNKRQGVNRKDEEVIEVSSCNS